jgi:hypothetical protein
MFRTPPIRSGNPVYEDEDEFYIFSSVAEIHRLQSSDVSNVRQEV